VCSVSSHPLVEAISAARFLTWVSLIFPRRAAQALGSSIRVFLFASQSCSQICVPRIHFSGCSCWIYLHPGPVKSSSGLPLPQRPDRRRPLRYWAVGPRQQRLYKWAREPRFVGQSNSTLSLVLISGDVRQRREAPLLPPPELTTIAGSEAMESSSSSAKTQGMNSDPRSKLIDYLEPD
jgi:hypothetical protein